MTLGSDGHAHGPCVPWMRIGMRMSNAHGACAWGNAHEHPMSPRLVFGLPEWRQAFVQSPRALPLAIGQVRCSTWNTFPASPVCAVTAYIIPPKRQ